jgi:ribosomal protein L7/L12
VNEDITIPDVLTRVAELERRVAYLEQLMNVRPWGADPGATSATSSSDVDAMWQDSSLAEVRDLVRQGKKIEAIKRYRELKYTGLREAKDAVDAMERGR